MAINGLNNYLPHVKRLKKTSELGSIYGEDGTLVYCKDVKCHFVYIQNGTQYTVDNQKVFAGNPIIPSGRWVAIDGQFNYFAGGKEYIYLTNPTSFAITELKEQVYVILSLSQSITIKLPERTSANFGKTVKIFILQSNPANIYTIQDNIGSVLMHYVWNIAYEFISMPAQYGYTALEINTTSRRLHTQKLAINSLESSTFNFYLNGNEAKKMYIRSTSGTIPSDYSNVLFNPTGNISITLSPLGDGHIYNLYNNSNTYNVTIQHTVDGIVNFTIPPKGFVSLIYTDAAGYRTISNNAFKFYNDYYGLIATNKKVVLGSNSVPESTLTVDGSIGHKVTTVTTNTTLNDTHNIVIVRPTTTSDIIITLPQLSTAQRRRYVIILDQSVQSGTGCVILPYGTETIENASTYSMSTHYETVTLLATSSTWCILNKTKKEEGIVEITNPLGYIITKELRNRTVRFHITASDLYGINIASDALQDGDTITIIATRTTTPVTYTLEIIPPPGAKINYEAGVVIQNTAGSIQIKRVNETTYIVTGSFGGWTIS